MESCELTHTAEITVVSNNHIYARFSPQEKPDDCGGCALAGVCGNSKSMVEVEVSAPPGMIPLGPGSHVRISPRPGARLRGTLLLFGLPLAVFLAVAAMLRLTELEQGLAALISLAAAALTYAVIHYLEKHRGKPMWYVCEILNP